MFRPNKIHQTPQELLTDAVEGTVRKLDEIKSASLITNRFLKDVRDKEIQKVSIIGADLVTIKGEKGEKGERGERGERGDDGKDGRVGLQGARGVKGEKGDKGDPGRDGVDGERGRDGNDAFLTPEEIVERINTTKRSIDFKVLRNIPQELHEAVDRIRNPIGKHFDVAGGANQFIIQSAGTRLSPSATTINFSTGLTASYSDGVITITSSGAILSATGTIDDSNTVFTFTSAPTELVINGASYQSTGGAITWTGTTTVTLSSAVGAGGSIYGRA